MAVLRVGPLPERALDAAEWFHATVLPKARRMLSLTPLRDGEDQPQAGGGGPPSNAAPAEGPLHPAASRRGPPSRAGEDLTLIFTFAPYDHGGWRLAAVQDLARAAAPLRVNGIVGDDEGAIAEALTYLETAPGITGQLLAIEAG